MNQHNFGAAVIPAMAGFFWFSKRAKVEEIQVEKSSQFPAVIKADESRQTGVTRYLMASPLVTTVTKYVKKKEQQPITGVAKYVLRQTIADRNAPSATGVSKYLVKASKEALGRKKTTIDKYLLKQELAEKTISALTGVAKYQAEQDLLEKKKALAMLVQQYKEQDEAAAKTAREAALAAYEAANAIIIEAATEEEVEAVSGVGRYLQVQAKHSKKTPKPTSVSRYISKKIALDSQKPVVSLSKVEKYLRDQTLVEIKKPKLTGVAKYLSQQKTVAKTVKTQVKQVESGVARYLAAQGSSADINKPVLSGVAKYLEKQAQLAHQTMLSLPDFTKAVLEGEFIPANEYRPATGVSRYLERQSGQLNASAEVVRGTATGVSRYLERQAGYVAQKTAPVPTGVDRYLLNRAA